MKILVVSDIIVPEFADAEVIPKIAEGVDLVLSCGDLPPEYLGLVARKTGAPLYYVLGNHDIRHTNMQIPGSEHIHRRIVPFEGVRIMGLSGSGWYNGGPNQYREHQMSLFLRGLWFSIMMQKKVDIVIAHAPPRGIGDAEDPCHQGFLCFRRFIERYRPAYFLHGHIHKDFRKADDRMSWLKNTLIVNCCGYHILHV